MHRFSLYIDSKQFILNLILDPSKNPRTVLLILFYYVRKKKTEQNCQYAKNSMDFLKIRFLFYFLKHLIKSAMQF